jgi:hypothetical protein
MNSDDTREHLNDGQCDTVIRIDGSIRRRAQQRNRPLNRLSRPVDPARARERLDQAHSSLVTAGEVEAPRPGVGIGRTELSAMFLDSMR